MALGTEKGSSREEKQWHQASMKAKRNFGYFLRELFWNGYRKDAKLDFAAALFKLVEEKDGRLVEERLWMHNIRCSGSSCYGMVLNKPELLVWAEQGKELKLPTKSLEDWIYVLDGKVYGAYTVHLRRAKMELHEREGHDRQWGYDFGDPDRVERYPGQLPKQEEPEQDDEEADAEDDEPTKFFGMTIAPQKKGDGPAKFLGVPLTRAKKEKEKKEMEVESPVDEEALVNQRMDHPMAVANGQEYVNYYMQNPTVIHDPDEMGNTALHSHAIVGNRAIVMKLLELGADPRAENRAGMTPKDVAKAMGWVEVATRLAAAERKG